MNLNYSHIRNGQTIVNIILTPHAIYQMNCPFCGHFIVQNLGNRKHQILYYNLVLNMQCQDIISWQGESTEMPRAYLEYLELNPQSGEGAYKLKFEGHFKQYIQPMVTFIKATIPGSDRTYDPNTYEWFFHEKYFDVMKTALEGSNFRVEQGVTKEQFEELRKQQEEYARQAGQSFSVQKHDTNEDLKSFIALLVGAGVKWKDDPANWSKDIAKKAYLRAIKYYHPDLNPGMIMMATQLNEVWSRLKEAYYIK